MRQFTCHTVGLPRPVLGRVTHHPVPKRDRPDHVLVWCRHGKPPAKGFGAIVTNTEAAQAKLQRRCPAPVVIADSKMEALREGDVLFIDPNESRISVLYESESEHNAILVTERCNCACIMCPQPPKSEFKSRTAFNCDLIRLMAPGPSSLALTGGEPTMLGDDLLVLLRACKQWLPTTDLVILTNARKLKARDYVESIARVGHPRLMMAVPLYGDVDFLHDEIVGARGAFRDTIEGLYNLALFGFPVEIRVVILSLNHDRLPKLAEFIYANLPFASHVAWMGMETTGLARQNLDRVWVDPYDCRDDLEAACRYLYRRMIPVSLYNLPLCILPKPLWPLARKSISEWKNVYLPECQSCAVSSCCCGLFASAGPIRSRIAPIRTQSVFGDGILERVPGPGEEHVCTTLEHQQ